MEVIVVLVWLACIVGYVVFLVAVWRGMKAHESIADSLREVVGVLRTRGGV